MTGIKVTRGERVTGNRLQIFVKDEFGAPVNPFSIFYSIFDRTCPTPILFAEERRRPLQGGTLGHFAADFTIDLQAPIGPWEIRWYIKRDELAEEVVIVEEFEVVSALQPCFGFEAMLDACTRGMISDLRVVLRDNNPDRHYHFRPPEHGVRIQNYTERFGFVWETPELLVALRMAVCAINLAPPRTDFCLQDFCPGRSGGDWCHLLMYKAASFAARMAQTNWIVDEFDYSLGNLSLNLERSSKYDSLASAWDQQFDSALELAKRTLKYTMGLKQSRFAGVSGLFSFGPSIRRVGLVNYPSILRS